MEYKLPQCHLKIMTNTNGCKFLYEISVHEMQLRNILNTSSEEEWIHLENQSVCIILKRKNIESIEWNKLTNL